MKEKITGITMAIYDEHAMARGYGSFATSTIGLPFPTATISLGSLTEKQAMGSIQRVLRQLMRNRKKEMKKHV